MADQQTRAQHELDDLTIDLARETVSRGGQVLEVRDLNFRLLAALMDAAPEPLSPDALTERVWGLPSVSDETLAQRVKLLRRALGDDARQPRYVKTVRGRGYAVASPLVPVQAAPRRPKWVSALAAVAVLAIVGAGLWLTPSGPSTITPDETARDAALSPVTQLTDRARQSIALHQPRETERAIALLEQALELAPDDRTARRTLSFALSTRATKFSPEPGDQERAESLALGLIEGDVSDSGAWTALGYALDSQGRVDEALAAYERAFTLNPDDTAALSSAAYLMQIRGRLAGALSLEARALERGGPSLYGLVQIATALSLLEDERAEAWWRKATGGGLDQIVVLAEIMQGHLRAGRPDHALGALAAAPADLQETPRLVQLSGRALAQQGAYGAAADRFADAGPRAALDLAAVRALMDAPGDPAPLLANLNSAMLEGDSWPELRVRAAEYYAAAGDAARAFSLLGRAVDLGWRDRASLRVSPFLAGLQNDPRWTELMTRIEREIVAQQRLLAGSPESQLLSRLE